MQMRSFIQWFAALFVLCCSTPAVQAQMVQDPTTWTYEVKSKGADRYELIFHLKLKPGWHIWSLKPGGDGFQIAPSFTLDPVPGVKALGGPKEQGQAITGPMEGIDGKVTYYSNQVDYTLNIRAPKGKLKGKHQYQVCNDSICLPPKTLKFEVSIP